ncbi:PIN domain-containing protein [Methanopyrus kandleri]|nr:PIN domain-containing protein [Methanopyrus kandleri]
MLDTNVVLRAVEELLSPSIPEVTRPVLISEGGRGVRRRLIGLKPSSREQRVESLYTFTFSLLGCLDVTLVVGPRLMKEYEKNLAGESFFNRCWNLRGVLQLLEEKCKWVDPDEELVELCRKAHPKDDPADAEHAAVCLQTKAVLVTLDVSHFSQMAEELRREGLALKWRTPFDFLQELGVFKCRG